MLTRLLCLPPAQLKPPFHLRHWEVEHTVVAIDQAECAKEVARQDEEPYEWTHDARALGEEGVLYVRVLYDTDREEWWVSILYNGWPAYMVNPWGNTHGYVRAGTLAEALGGIHRLFPHYTHRDIAPIPFFGTWIDYCLTEEAMEMIEQEVVGQGIGVGRADEGA